MKSVLFIFSGALGLTYCNTKLLSSPARCDNKEPFRIAILGATGNGKSSLVNNILGRSVAEVGDSAQGVTKDIICYNGKLHGRDLEIIDLPGFGDQTINVRKMLEQWNKEMAHKQFDIVLYTHKASDTRLNSFDASYFEVIKKSIKEESFCDRTIVAITWWNIYNRTLQAEKKSEFFRNALLSNMTSKLELRGEDRIKNIMFFTDSEAEVQAEIAWLIQKLEKTDLNFTNPPGSFSILSFCKGAAKALQGPTLEAISQIITKHTGLPPKIIERVVYSKSGGGCFHSNCKVKTKDGQIKEMSSLQIGDEVQTVDKNQTQIKWERVNNFILKDSDKISEFVKINTPSTVLQLTPNHKVLAKNNLTNGQNYLQAKDLAANRDSVLVYKNGTYEWEPIQSCTETTGKGIYCPLTFSGTIVVDNVVASCYATSAPQSVAKFFLYPLNYFMIDHNLKGKHPYAAFMQKFTRFPPINGSYLANIAHNKLAFSVDAVMNYVQI